MARSFAEAFAEAGWRPSFGTVEEGRDWARDAAVALEQETAALTEALSAVTHRYRPGAGPDGSWCTMSAYDGSGCYAPEDTPEHHTPEWVRQRCGFGV